MLCDDCKKNEACVFMTQITGNQKIEKHLCEDCAKKYGEALLNVGQNFSVNDFLAGIFNHVQEASEQQEERPKNMDACCPNCKMQYREVIRKGKIGCSECYSAFAEQLQPLFRRIHGSSSHIGKLPKRSGGEMAVKQKIKRLRAALKQHVEREEYEQAAKLRDTIKQLEQQCAAQQKGAEE